MDNNNFSQTTNETEKGADNNAPKKIITRKRIFAFLVISIMLGVSVGVLTDHYRNRTITKEKTGDEATNLQNAPQGTTNVNKNKVIPYLQTPDSNTVVTQAWCMDKINSWPFAVALGNYEQICPDKLKSLCESVAYPPAEGDAKLEFYAKSLCDWICDMVHISSNDSDYFNNIVLNWGFTDNYQGTNTKYAKIDNIVISGDSFYTPPLWRIAIAYRVDKNRANEICNIYDNDSNRKKLCLTNAQNEIKYISDIENNCSKYIDKR